MLKERTLEHQQTYQYKVHLSKLALTASAVAPNVAAKVTNYLLSVFGEFPDDFFRDDPTSNPDRRRGRRRTAIYPPTATSLRRPSR
jgi:hypothetical protein